MSEHLYQVGKPYVNGKTQWVESCQYNYCADRHELKLFYKTPSTAEIEAVRTGAAHFALWPQGDVIYFCFRFGIMPWSDSNYNWWLVDEEHRTLPPNISNAGKRILLITSLVDADTGILQAMRVCRLSARFTRILHNAIWQQSQRQPVTEMQIAEMRQRVYSLYTCAHIAQQLAIVRCKGGD